MPISIIANRSAQYAQSAMLKQSAAISLSTLKVSTGNRVTDASQDAGALAVGTSLKIENASLASAANNATSAVSMLQIADGAMGQISDILNRMSTLATQASSGHLDDVTRSLVDREYQTLKQEVSRLAASTSFNGVSMLAGTSKLDITAGSSLAAVGVSSLVSTGTNTSDSTFRMSYDPTTESLTLARVGGGSAATQTLDLTQLLDTVAGNGANLTGASKLDVTFAQLGVTLTLNNNFDRTATLDPTATTVATNANLTVASPATTLPTTGVSLETVAGLTALGSGYSSTTGALSLTLDSDGTNVNLAALPGISYVVNGAATASGAASAALDGTANTIEVYVDLPSGGTQLLGTLATGAVATTGVTTSTLTMNVGQGLIAVDNVDTGSESTGSTQLTYKVGSGIVSGQDLVNVTIPAMNLTALGLTNSTVDTEADANTAIDALKAAMQVLDTARSEIGAQQVRMESVSQTLSVVQQNNESARSSLLDVDISSEITNLTENQTLMQASIAMLKQANQIPSMLLDMLK